jgi:hypothetical protein
MFKPVLFLFILISTTVARADWVYNRPEVGLGFSDNVYQDDFNKKSDAYTWFQFTSKYDAGDSTWTGRIYLNLYKSEYLNNYAMYSLRRGSEISADTEMFLSLGGLAYLKQDKGATDESYNNFYLAGYISKTVKEGSNYKINVEPGAKFITYPHLDRRVDMTAYVGSDITWQTRSTTEINPYGEIGYVFSNQGYYSRRYVALGVMWNEKLHDNYSFTLDYYIRNTVYPNRTVSDILFTPNRTGRATGKAFDIHESIGLRQLSASITKSFLEYELTAGYIYAAETSLSELEKYRENQVYISAVFEL